VNDWPTGRNGCTYQIPHYSIFGDTVEIASLMESTGQAMKIQLSQSTTTILEETGGFTITPRGVVTLGDIGEYHTFWLVGRKE